MLMAWLVCDFEIKASLILVRAGLKAVSSVGEGRQQRERRKITNFFSLLIKVNQDNMITKTKSSWSGYEAKCKPAIVNSFHFFFIFCENTRSPQLLVLVVVSVAVTRLLRQPSKPFFRPALILDQSFSLNRSFKPPLNLPHHHPHTVFSRLCITPLPSLAGSPSPPPSSISISSTLPLSSMLRRPCDM